MGQRVNFQASILSFVRSSRSPEPGTYEAVLSTKHKMSLTPADIALFKEYVRRKLDCKVTFEDDSHTLALLAVWHVPLEFSFEFHELDAEKTVYHIDVVRERTDFVDTHLKVAS